MVELGMVDLDDVLAIRYPSDVGFTDDGAWLAWRWTDGARTDLWCADPDRPGTSRQVTHSGSVSSWAPCGSGTAAWTDGDGIGVVDLGHMAPAASVPVGSAAHVAVRHCDGMIAAIADNQVVAWRPDGQPHHWSLPVRAGIINPGPAKALQWSPSGQLIAVATRDDGRRGIAVVDTGPASRDVAPQRDVAPKIVWEGPEDGFVTGFTWMDGDLLQITVDVPPTTRRHELVDPRTAATTTILIEHGDAVVGGAGAHGFPVAAVASPDGRRLAITRYRDNWAHLDLWSLDERTLIPLTHGAFDVTGGGRFDHPRWTDDASGVLVCISRDDWSQRQVARIDVPGASIGSSHATAEPRTLTNLTGTNWWPVPRPGGTSDLAFLHASAHASPDVWMLDASSGSARQVSRSMPNRWQGTTLAPRHVRIPARDGTPLHADLYVSGSLDADQPRPALVFAHGGTIDQMRHGWHPGLPYLAPMSWHQYLVQRGWVVLTIDYRGSAGYGLDYQMALWGRMGDVDVTDVVDAGRWLADQPGIDPTGVAVWGISYGGYLALSALTKHPGAFAAGISVAGVWDWELVRDERTTSDRLLAQTGAYRMTAGATGAEADRRWATASPSAFAADLSDPLLVLHGTGDLKVTMTQTDHLVATLTELDRPVEVIAYPGEQHVFVHRETWRDAYAKMEGFLTRAVTSRVERTQ